MAKTENHATRSTSAALVGKVGSEQGRGNCGAWRAHSRNIQPSPAPVPEAGNGESPDSSLCSSSEAEKGGEGRLTVWISTSKRRDSAASFVTGARIPRSGAGARHPLHRSPSDHPITVARLPLPPPEEEGKTLHPSPVAAGSPTLVRAPPSPVQAPSPAVAGPSSQAKGRKEERFDRERKGLFG